MPPTNDLDYYRQRERTTREQSAAASDPGIAAIYRDMADRYAALVEEQKENSSSRQTLKLKST